MKLTINRDAFLKKIFLVNKVISKSSPNPILSMIKLETTNQGLSLIGSSDSFSIFTNIPIIKNDQELIRDIIPGSILIDGNNLLEAVRRAISAKELVLDTVEDSLINIKSLDGDVSYDLHTTNGNEYVEIDFSKNGTQVELSAKDFVEAVSQVAFSASNKSVDNGNTSNYRDNSVTKILSAVNVSSSDGLLSFVATDGARLAKYDISKFNSVNPFVANIPAKALIEIARSITTEEKISFYVNEKKTLFILNETFISVNLTEGSYPNTKNIIPKTFNYFLEVNSQDFLNSLNIVGLCAGERDNVAKMSMNETNVNLISVSQINGKAESKLNLFKFVGNRLEISFNCEYVSSAIRALKTTDIVFSFLGEMKPFTITAKNNSNAVQLITPVRTY